MSVIQVIERLAAVPKEMKALLERRDAARDKLHRALDRVREIEVEVAGQVAADRDKYSNEAARNAETARRLKKNQEWVKLRDETVPAARRELEKAEAALEQLRMQFQADIAVAGLVAALYHSGDPEKALRVLEAYSRGAEQERSAEVPESTPPDPIPEQPALAQEQPQGNGLETGTFTVLEARHGSSPGTVRAWCQGRDGQKVAVYGKHGAGEALAGAVGKQVEVKFRRGDKGLIAIGVRPVA